MRLDCGVKINLQHRLDQSISAYPKDKTNLILSIESPAAKQVHSKRLGILRGSCPKCPLFIFNSSRQKDNNIRSFHYKKAK